ncbi:MAG: surface lipoprotein assembly modifier [Cognatishimia sp.]
MEPKIALQHAKIAQTDAKAGKFSQAKLRYEWLLLNDTANSKRSTFYQNAIRTLTSKKPLSFGLSAALLASSNAGRSSSEATFHTDLGDFTIGDPDASQSGIGLRINATGTYKYAYAPGRDLSATAKLGTSLHESDSLRSSDQTLTLAHRWLVPGARYTLSVAGKHTSYPTLPGRSAPDNNTLSASLNAYHALPKNRALSYGISVRDQTYTERSYLDGVTTSLNAAYSFPISKRGNVTLMGGASTANLQAGHFSYSGFDLGLRYSHKSNSGFDWSLGYHASQRDYDDIFTALSYARSDKSNTISIGLSHRDIRIKEMTPSLNCFAKRQSSNVALYTYDTFDCSVSLKHAF